MRTEIATLGEFGLIDHLTEGIQPRNESTRYGIGDDAAVLSYPADKEVLVTTDLLLEGVHFDLTYVPLKHLGYKAAVVNFSDIYTMWTSWVVTPARPTQASPSVLPVSAKVKKAKPSIATAPRKPT